MIETRRLKNVVILVQTILSFLLSRKIIKKLIDNILGSLLFNIAKVGSFRLISKKPKTL